MSPTEFSDLEQIGAVIYKRLRQNVRAEHVVLLGSSPNVQDDFRIWSGFLKAATADGEKIVYFSPRGFPPVPANPAWESLQYEGTAIKADELLNQIKERLAAKRLIVVHAPVQDVSHFVKTSLSRQVDRIAQHPVLSISSLRFALSREEQDSLQSHCLDTQSENEGENRLSCASQKVSRKYQRKNLDASKIWAVIERHGLKEYLVFVHVP